MMAFQLRGTNVLPRQAEADEQVGLTASHGLFEMENSLRRGSR